MLETARRHLIEAVDAERAPMLTVLQESVRIPSVGGSTAENEAQAFCADHFREAGLEVDHWPIPLQQMYAAADFPGVEVERSQAWGVVGQLEGSGGGASLLYNGHVDVVPPGDRSAWSDDPYSGRIGGDRLYGRGACDMKAGLVAALWAIRAVRRAGQRLQGDLLLAGVQGEEDGGLGSYALLTRGWRADACVIPEPTGLDLVPACSGALTFRLRVPGHATHASRRSDGVSAIEKFWPIWQALTDLERRRNTTTDPLVARWSVPYPLVIGRVSSGDWASSVPDLLVAEGRLGVALDEPVPQARAALEEAVASACAADPWLSNHPVRVEWWGGQFASGRLAADSDLLQRVRAAHASVAGGDEAPAEWAAPYGSDLRLLTGLGGVPTLHYGPGDAALAHGPDESVPLDQVATAARTLAVLAVEHSG